MAPLAEGQWLMLASSAGDRIRDLGCRAMRRDAHSGFGSVGDCRSVGLKTSSWPTKVVGLGRLELPTSRLSSARSNQLSYKPKSRILDPPKADRRALSGWERETKTAASRKVAP